jgi:hypothetical protein
MVDTPYQDKPPHEDDLRHDEMEFDPAVEPRKSLAWLNLLEESEAAFEKWNDHCDKIDQLFASLERLANVARNREFQMFWANCEVLKPAIYAKAPVPVVAPKFKDRRPIYQAASEMLERCNIVAFDLAYINDVMKQIRDDVALLGRGVAWVRYESARERQGYYATERICIDFKHRRDFLHSISRCWYEVTWVAGASYLTRSQARERFYKHSGDCYQDAEYRVDKDSQAQGGADERERAKFWEIWHKGERRVVWVAQGCEDILDEANPHLDLAGFFPCPQPAYGTLQRYTLVPVPDVLQYKDQLDEVNLLTGRIHALSDALQMKGFYPAGGGETADAIQTALKANTPGVDMVPISNWAAFGGSKEVILWMPIEQIAGCITALIAERKQIIDDIYQIMGLSDIMRGATNPQETLGAQQLKTEYGSSRTRDKQYELVRIARDLVAICSDIMCEKFEAETLIEMSQTQLPTRDMVRQTVVRLQQQGSMLMRQMQQAQTLPQVQQLVAQNPDQANAMLQGVQQQVQQIQAEIEKTQAKPTIEQVLDFLHDHRARAFVLDIETDSTIMADENAEKQRRTEFVTALAGIMPLLGQMIAADPGAAELCGDILKFSTSAFRASRSLDNSIDGYVERLKAKGEQTRGDDPTTATNKTALQIEQLKQKSIMDKNQADVALRQAELQMKDQHEKMKIQSQQQIEFAKLQSKHADDAAKAAQTNQKAMTEREAHQADLIGKQHDMAINAQKAAMAQAAAQAKQTDMAARGAERAAAAQVRHPPEFAP